MKNLIEEINENKLLSNSKISEDFKRGFNRGLDLSQEIINQYNIITAPKTIKLSELIKPIKEYFNSELIIIRKSQKYYNCYLVCRKSLFENEDYELLIRDNVIEDIDVFCCYFKKEVRNWLYALWIAGTIIEDDMKEEE